MSDDTREDKPTMAKIKWAEGEPDFAQHPSDHQCVCENRNPNDHVLTITEGTPAVTHIVCDKQIDDQGYIEDWNTSEPIPVRAEFVDEGMNHYTGEHNGWWWELSPRAATYAETAEIAWLREQVAKSTPEDRKAAYKMADMGDLNEGYIAALLEASSGLLAKRDEVGERAATLEDGIRAHRECRALEPNDDDLRLWSLLAEEQP